MLDESGLAAPGWPLEHNWHLAVRRDREQTDLATDLLVEWLARDPILSDVDFASLLHRCVSLPCLVYVVYLIRCSHDKRNGGRRSSDLAGISAHWQAGGLPISHTCLWREWPRLSFTARIERAPSEYLLFFPVTLSGLAARAIPTAAVERALFHRARSG